MGLAEIVQQENTVKKAMFNSFYGRRVSKDIKKTTGTISGMDGKRCLYQIQTNEFIHTKLPQTFRTPHSHYPWRHEHAISRSQKTKPKA